jgi:heme-degrading monooxygenase HmoA
LDYGFLVIWQFQVRAGMEPTFEAIYGPAGDWVALFRTGEGFLRTELIHSRTEPQVYLTLDYWTSAEAYEAFRQRHSADYQAIDARCEELTEEETDLGQFNPLPLT